MKPKTLLILLGVGLLALTVLSKAQMVSVGTRGLSSHASLGSKSESRRGDRHEIEHPISTHRVFLPYWRTDGGFYSKIYMRNVNVRRPMIVSLSLVTPNDTTKLSDMKIDPAQTISVDVAEALLANSKPGSTEGSAFIDFTAESRGAINAFAQIVNERESTALSFPFQRESMVEGPLEAVAWAYDSDTDAYIALQNTSKNTIHATPILSIGPRNLRLNQVKLKALETTTLKLPRADWSDQKEFPHSFGVTIEQNNDRGGLVAQGWATNPIRGFSTGFAFSPRTTCNCGPGRKHNLYGTGIPIGPSAMMGGAIFDPVLILRNLSPDRLSVIPVFSYMAGDVAQTIKLPSVRLAPGESAVRKLRQYQLSGIIPDSVSTGGIHLQYESDKGGLIAELASVDLTGFYNSQVPLTCGGKNALHMSYWRTDGDWDSVLQIENVSEQQTVAELTISYPGGLYVAERPLKAGELATISVKHLQQNQVPDKDGRRIPLSATVGGMNIWSKDVNQALVINGTVINSVTGTCGFCGGFGAVQFYGLTDASQNCFGAAFEDYGVNETIPIQMYMYFDTAQCGSDSIQHLQVSTPGVVQVADSTTLLTVGTGIAQFSAETQGSWSGPDDPNCLAPTPLGASDSIEIYATIGGIQYQSGSNFIDIAGTLYVLKDTTVTFKAIPDPPGGSFPTPTWSGTSGASGSGVTKAVTFSTVSSSLTDFKTVVATSNNSVTVNVVVFTLTGVRTPQDNFTGRSLTSFGLAEVIALSFTASPAVTATQAGGLLWKQTAGTGNLTGASDGTGSYTAAAGAESVTLKLEIQAGPSKTLGPSSTISIIGPSGAAQTQNPGTGIKHVQGTCSAGFRALTFLLPKTVSFTNIEVREGSTTAVATGWLAASNGNAHSTGSWFPVANCSTTTGCQIMAVDTIYNEYPQNYGGTTWGIGDFQWNIPRQWRVGAGTATQFTSLLHHFVSDAAGKGTVSKGGAGPFSKNANDATSGF